MHRPLVRPLVRGLVRSITGSVQTIVSTVKRWMYNLDGVDDRGVTITKAINVDNDIDISWEQKGYNSDIGNSQTIVSQCVSATSANREFVLRAFVSEQLEFVVGGVSTSPSVNYGDGKWQVTLIGTQFRIFRDDVQVHSATFTRGAAREPTAQTVIGARFAGSYVEHMNGKLFNININGILWALNVPYQAIQLPTPTGLGADFWAARNFQVANAATVQTNISGSEWVVTRTAGSALADGMRSGNIPTVVGQTYYFEIDEASAPVNLVAYTSGFALITSQANSRRLVFTATTTATLIYVCPVATATPVTVKVAKLYTASTVTSYIGNLSGTWSVFEGSQGTNTATVIVVTGAPNSAATRSLPSGLVAGKTVTVTFTSSLTGGEFYFRNDSQGTVVVPIVSGTNTLTFTPTAGQLLDHYFSVERVGGSVSLTINSISSTDISSNILVLTNTTNERWEEVTEGEVVTIPNFNFSNQTNSQYLPLL